MTSTSSSPRTRRTLPGDVHFERAPPRVLRALDREAPTCWPFERPIGSARVIADGGVSAAVKLQEVFGLAETPRLGPARVPVLFSLLAPNGRPVQLTRDLGASGTARIRGSEGLRGRSREDPWPGIRGARRPARQSETA